MPATCTSRAAGSTTTTWRTTGIPSKVGFKDLCPLWKAAEFEPEHLMGLYKRAGAKYFVSMGVHHDNFDLWNSRHTRWNAVKVGPHKDVVGLWRAAALKNGLKFGVSEHLWISYKWFAVSHGSDKTGPLAGVPYDGVNPAYADLYHDASVAKWAYDTHEQFGWNDVGIPDSWKHHWFLRMQDLVDNYQPDLLYTDGPLPFENYGYSAVANLYNLSAEIAWWAGAGGLHEQKAGRLRSRHLCAGHRARTGEPDPARSLANRYLYRGLALQPRSLREPPL